MAVVLPEFLALCLKNQFEDLVFFAVFVSDFDELAHFFVLVLVQFESQLRVYGGKVLQSHGETAPSPVVHVLEVELILEYLDIRENGFGAEQKPNFIGASNGDEDLSLD